MCLEYISYISCCTFDSHEILSTYMLLKSDTMPHSSLHEFLVYQLCEQQGATATSTQAGYCKHWSIKPWGPRSLWYFYWMGNWSDQFMNSACLPQCCIVKKWADCYLNRASCTCHLLYFNNCAMHWVEWAVYSAENRHYAFSICTDQWILTLCIDVGMNNHWPVQCLTVVRMSS